MSNPRTTSGTSNLQSPEPPRPPEAWKTHSTPPTGHKDLFDPAFRSWHFHSNPSDAFAGYVRRAKGAATFLHFVFSELSRTAFEQQRDDPGGFLPQVTLYRPEMDGLVEILAVIGESIDLANDASESMVAAAKESRP
ncbi:MAG: hypothetical protein HQL56_19230 [Magnetococcales bacterium]|nr:hypothetical protein [Magnetococcales bacterium]